VVAVGARLVPLLGGGGFFGLGNYDDGVDFAAAIGLAHGFLPYRDFLLLHPPGITLALFPFALLGRVLGDANSFAIARSAWMVMGAANAVLVARTLRSSGPLPALVGGIFYAVYPPAVYNEHSTLLEVPQTLCLLLAMYLLIGRHGSDAQTGRTEVSGRAALVAGMLLGAAAGVKIWGVVMVAAICLWCTVAAGRRWGGLLLAGAATGVTAVCLPFFLVAPKVMWRMVVLDQLGRSRADVTLVHRFKEIVGLAPIDKSLAIPPLLQITVLGAAVLGGSAACVLAWRLRAGRLAVVVLVAVNLLLVATPSWYLHYAGLVAAPAAVIAGAATATYWRWLSGTRLAALALVPLVAVLAAYTVPVMRLTFGRPFPSANLAAAARNAPGCVTSDDPTTLIELNVLSRNLERRCPPVVDLTGYFYDLKESAGNPSRREDSVWQQYAIAYLKSGSITIVDTSQSRLAFSPSTVSAIGAWPAIARADTFALRQPRPSFSPVP
jgi:hypothetical protein